MIRGFLLAFVVAFALSTASQSSSGGPGKRLAIPTYDLSATIAKWQFQPQAKFEFNAGDADNPGH